MGHPRSGASGSASEPALDRYRSAVESRAAEDPSADHVLEEGDVLYLPRGFIHSAEALGGVSIHLTIGIHSHTRHDLVRSLLELAEEDPRLRRSLPLGVDVGDPAQLSSDLAATVDGSRRADPGGPRIRRCAGDGAARRAAARARLRSGRSRRRRRWNG